MTNTEATDTTTAAAVAEQGAHVAPERAPAKKAASRKQGAARAKTGAKKAKPAAAKRAAGKNASKTKPTAKARKESKSSIILSMIAKGTTLVALMTATAWQAHSVRGFLSTAAKKHGLKIESMRNKDGERVYRIAR